MNDHDANTALDRLPAGGPVVKDGKIGFPGLDMSVASLVRRDDGGWQPVPDLDAAPLLSLLDALLEVTRKSGRAIAAIFLPEFREIAGHRPGSGKNAFDYVRDLFQRYDGVSARFENGSTCTVLSPLGHDAETDTVEYFSPYVDYLLRKI